MSDKFGQGEIIDVNKLVAANKEKTVVLMMEKASVKPGGD